MTESPELIWARANLFGNGYGTYQTRGPETEFTEYVRADLAPASREVAVKPDSIVTDFVCPPIPDRSHDWYARFKWADGDTECYGEGETEESAIIDLLNKAVEYDGDGSEQEEVIELALSALTAHPAPAPEQPSVQEAARVLLGAMPNYVMERAALESRADDDEGPFESLSDLLNFSGQNKSYTVIREAICAALRALTEEKG